MARTQVLISASVRPDAVVRGLPRRVPRRKTPASLAGLAGFEVELAGRQKARCELGGGQRAAEQVALVLVAAQAGQRFELTARLDALRGDVQSERMRH